MTKVSRKYISPENFGALINDLWSAFTLMNTKDEIRLLFKDLFTPTEFKMSAKRLRIALLLLGGYGYDNIQKELGVTSGTIATVNNILSEKGDGFRIVWERLKLVEEERDRKRQERIADLSNPFRRQIRNHNKTVLGAVLKAGLAKLDKKITQQIKQKSVKKVLKT